jgi:uncharacterized SAM-binding protein YcdF (DUF218 family)
MSDPASAPEISRDGAAAIVLLGCRVAACGRLAGASARRAARAARAFHEGAAPVVIASGGVRWSGVTEAEALCRELVLEGVPRAAIMIESSSVSTRQNARFVAELVRERWIAPRLALVTCDWHMPRALRCFRSVGLDAFGLSASSPEVGALRRLARGAGEAVSGWVDRAVLRGHAPR